jgi:hypothetical protein
VNISDVLPGIIIFVNRISNNKERVMEGISLLDGYILSTFSQDNRLSLQDPAIQIISVIPDVI